MADLDNLPDLTLSTAAFRELWSDLIADKGNRNPVRTARDAASRPVAEWADWVDGVLLQLQDDYTDRIANPPAEVHVEPFGTDHSTGTSAQYLPFNGWIVDESFSGNQPRAHHLWRVPVTGTVSTIRSITEGSPGTATMQFYEPDGSTTIGVASTSATSTIDGTSGANTLYETVHTFATPVPLTAGAFVALVFSMTLAPGEHGGRIELQP